jgi:hypothetical protein
MERHMQTVELFGAGKLEMDPSPELLTRVDRFLADPGADFDDSEIYDLIDKASKPKRRSTRTWATKKIARKPELAPPAPPPPKAPEPPAVAVEPGESITASAGTLTKVRRVRAGKARQFAAWDDDMLCG